MKTIFLALAAGVILLGRSVAAEVPAAQTPPPGELQTLMERHVAAQSAGKQEHSGRLAKVRSWYDAQLDTLQKEATAKGDLDSVLAIKKERERGDRRNSPEETRTLPAAVGALRAKFDQSLDQLAATQQTNELAAVREFAVALDGLQKRLTQKGDIDGALKVKAQRQTVLGELAFLEAARTPPPGETTLPLPPPMATPAPVSRLAAPSATPRFFDKKPDPNSPVGTWSFQSGDAKPMVRTFYEDGTVTGDGFEGVGKWKITKTKILVSYPGNREGSIDLPLNPKGTKAYTHTGKQMMAIRQTP